MSMAPATAWYQRGSGGGGSLELTAHGESALQERYDRVAVGDEHDRERLEDVERISFDTLLLDVIRQYMLPYPIAIGGIFLYVRHLYERIRGAKTTSVGEHQDAFNVYALYRAMLPMALRRRAVTDDRFAADTAKSVGEAHRRHLTRFGDMVLAEREFDVTRGGGEAPMSALLRFQQLSFALLTSLLRSYEMALAALLDFDLKAPWQQLTSTMAPQPAVVDEATRCSCLAELTKLIARLNASITKPECRYSVDTTDAPPPPPLLLLPSKFLNETLRMALPHS
jgi:hypothetical protein